MPDGATDVSYYRGFRGTRAFEFTIDEAGFRNWVSSGIGTIESNSAEVSLAEVTSAAKIVRYGDLSPEPDDPEEAVITEGLTYCWEKEDRGVYAMFDRTTARAYYFAHSH